MSLSNSANPAPLRVAVVGAGPAGLRAAEVAAAGGAQVTVFEAKGSVGRKFLIAGRSGLNLTNDAKPEVFLEQLSGPSERWTRILEGFDNQALRDWASALGVETFVSHGGKVLPNPVDGRMKATPLLRRWISRLNELGVEFHLHHRWCGFDAKGELLFESKQGSVRHGYDRVVLALGGASWPKTGSDGSWTGILEQSGISITPLAPANCGWEVDWPTPLLEAAEGLPLKNLQLSVAGSSCAGELVITRYGLEGAPIYRLGPQLREQTHPQLRIDFKPDQSKHQLAGRLGNVRRNYVREARRRLNLDQGTCALLKFLPHRGPWQDASQLIDVIKDCRVDLLGPRPIAEAISSAGGVAWGELNEDLMLNKMPGVYVAGEMIDWEAPTGGYLLQGCFASGTCVGRAVLGPLEH